MLRIVIAVAAAAVLAGCVAAPSGGAPRKTVSFSGRIVSASGRYTNLRGTVRLVLGSSSGPVSPLRASTIAFTLTLSGPSCKRQVVTAPRRCTSLHGTLGGDALEAPLGNPDAGREFTLGGHGSVAPLRRTTTPTASPCTRSACGAAGCTRSRRAVPHAQ